METKKRVVMFVPKFPVTTETFIQREIAQLARRSVLDIRILAIEKGSARLDPSLAGKVVYKSAGVWTILSSPVRLLFRCIVNRSRVLAAWRALTGDDVSAGKSLVLLLRAVCFYADVFKSLKPDFVYAHFLSEPSSVAMGACVYLNVPFGISAHAKDVLVNAQLIKSKIARARFINVCNLNAWRYCVDRAGELNTANVVVRYHGISFDSINYSRGAPNAIPLLLNNSRMTTKKGQSYLLEAVKLLTDRGRPCRLKIISGGGTLYDTLSGYVREHGLSEVVEFVNDGKPIFYEEVEKYYNSADLFVFPSIEDASGDADGIANVLIEAAAYKVPIIATGAGSSSELVIDGKTGIVVPQRDSVALAEAIERALDNYEETKVLAANANALVREKFDLARNVQLIESDILEACR